MNINESFHRGLDRIAWRLVGGSVVGVLALVAAACSSDSTPSVGLDEGPDSLAESRDATPTRTPRPPTPLPTLQAVPDGWEPFDSANVHGSLPPGWETRVLSASEMQKLVSQGLDVLEASDKLRDSLEDFDEKDLVGGAVVLLMPPELFKNITVIPCQPGASPVTSSQADEFAKLIEKSTGLAMRHSGDVEVRGRNLGIFLLRHGDLAEARQVYFGSAACTSIATLSTRPGDVESVEEFKLILQQLEVTRP